MRLQPTLMAAILLSALTGTAQIPVNTSKKVLLQGKTNNNSGYFRVVAKGFTCLRETADDLLERDGKRDEIYISSSSVMVNGGTQQTIENSAVRIRTKTLGDINARNPEEYRWMAGSADGGLGGIRSGDNLPDAEPWKNNAPVSGDLLPFVMWEGQLSSGGDYALIHPNVMEWDGPADFLTNLWHNSIVGTVLRPAVGLASVPFMLFTTTGNTNLGSGFVYDESSPGIWPAPEAIQNFGNIFYRADLSSLSAQQLSQLTTITDRPMDRPIGADARGVYNPLEIRLSFPVAMQLVEKDFGYGKGIIPIRYKDADQWKGEYILYVAIEKVDDPSQRSRINITHQNVFDPIAWYSFRSVHAPDKETYILNGGMVSNTPVVLNDLVGLKSQRWRIRKINQYYFNITNQYNNLNLDILNKNDINGSNIVTSAPDGSETQQWSFIGYCDGSWLLRNVRTRRIMEVYNAQTATGSPLGQWDAMHTANQRWFIEKK